MNNTILLDQLRSAILSCDSKQIMSAAEKAIQENFHPNKIIAVAVEAVGLVGKAFEEGRIFLPELMLAGLGMEKAMLICQNELLKRCEEETGPKVKIVIGSVIGDVHTIGKDLVITLLRSRGFQVRDLGVNLSSKAFLSAAKEFQADIVGLSALMSTTLVEQKTVIDWFNAAGERGHFKIIVGGGVCTQEWADSIGADGYAKDAATAVTLVERLMSGTKSASDSETES